MKLVTMLFILSAAATVTSARQRSSAQATGAASFEVVSIKENLSADRRSSFRVQPDGMLRITNATLLQLIIRAYELDPPLAGDLVTPGSGTVFTRRFDIQAKPPAGSPPEGSPQMLRALLSDRFKLRVHKESRETQVYALTVAKNGKLGPSLRPSAFTCVQFAEAIRSGKDPQAAGGPVGSDKSPWCFPSPANSGGLHMRSASSIGVLIGHIQGFAERPIVDETGLSGNFEWELTFSPVPSNPKVMAPRLSDALEEQLGLRLVGKQSLVERVVIDGAEMPSED